MILTLFQISPLNASLKIRKSAGILLANGRLGNDTKHGSSYSYYSKNTCSTIDYVISNEFH